MKGGKGRPPQANPARQKPLARNVTKGLASPSTPPEVARVNTMQPALTSSSPAAADPAGPVARRGAILVIEDRDDVRQGLAQLLELHGFLVVDAASGAQALEHLRTDPRGFAAILLDLAMPGPLSGSDFRSQQLATPELARIPTIVVTATEATDALREQLSADAWVEKPFRFDHLLAIVRQYVTPEAGGLITE